MNDRELYSIVGISTLLTTVTLPTISILPLSIGAIGVGSLYGCYRILTRHERRIKEERKEFEEFFKGLGLHNRNEEFPQLTNIWETENGHIYSFINPIGLSSKSYEDRDIAIREYLKCNKVLYESNGDFINIQTIETTLPTIVPFILPKRKSDDLIIELGVNELGKKVEINFNKIHSWLVAGATGSGKSVCTHNILTQLYCNYSDCTEFYIVDLKKTELNNYRNLKSTIEYVDKVDDVEPIIDKLLEECDRRHQLFTKYKVKNLQQYNKKVKNKLPNIVLCIEECVRIMGDKKLQDKISELAFISRSAGIVMIMTIQRCTKNLFSPDIKASLLGKIGFKVVSRINSQVIMDDDRLFKIKDRGECCISCDDISIGETNVKVMYLEEYRIDKILEENCIYK